MHAVTSDVKNGGSPHVVTLMGLSNDLLRRPWTVVALVLGCAIGSALVRLLQPRIYTASASFVPETAVPLGEDMGVGLPALSGLGSFGSARGAAGSSRPQLLDAPSAPLPSAPPVAPLAPSFYWNLLHSRELLLAVAGSRFEIETPTGVRAGTAADFYGLPAGPAATRNEDAARRLDRELEVDYNALTNVLTVRVRTVDPAFARAVAERMLAEVMATNRRMADDRAKAKVRFLTQAVADARSELLVAQNGFARFLSSNRAYLPSSPVALEFRRRDADVLEKRRTYGDLALQLERAKLDRSRAMQIISVVERPEVPSRPDPRGTARGAMAGAIGGFAVALLVLLTSGHLARLRAAGSDELRALTLEWRSGRRGWSERNASTASGLGSGQER